MDKSCGVNIQMKPLQRWQKDVNICVQSLLTISPLRKKQYLDIGGWERTCVTTSFNTILSLSFHLPEICSLKSEWFAMTVTLKPWRRTTSYWRGRIKTFNRTRLELVFLSDWLLRLFKVAGDFSASQNSSNDLWRSMKNCLFLAWWIKS